jgi:hypothetical protein
MSFLLSVLLQLAVARRKKKVQNNIDDDEPVKTAPEYGKVWHPEPKKWNHFVGRDSHAVVAFIDDDAIGASISKMMNSVLNMIDMSKINLVVAENWRIGQIIEDQGVKEFPSIRFYKSGMKKWSHIYEGNYTPKSIAKWANGIVKELEEMEFDE